jgi:hypothetical protein
MGFAEMMAEAMGETGTSGMELIKDIDKIKGAMQRPRLTDLQPGEILRQKKLGDGYRYKGGDEQTVFVRYSTEADRPAMKNGAPLICDDIVVASGIDSRDGELILHSVNSTHYERA